MTTSAAACLSLLALYVAAVAILSLRAERRLKAHPRLPMQWGTDWTPRWMAPRRLALTFAPVVGGAGPLIITAITTLASTPHQEPGLGLIAALMILTGGAGVLAHAFYLRLVDHWARTSA